MLSPFSFDDLRRQFRRKLRQMRGQLQNAAISELIYRAGYEGLPEDADEMVESFLANHAPPRVGWPDRMFRMLAIREMRRAPRPRTGQSCATSCAVELIVRSCSQSRLLSHAGNTSAFDRSDPRFRR